MCSCVYHVRVVYFILYVSVTVEDETSNFLSVMLMSDLITLPLVNLFHILVCKKKMMTTVGLALSHLQKL